MSPYFFLVVVLNNTSRKSSIASRVVFDWVPCSKWLLVTAVMKKSFSAKEVYTAELYLQSSY